MQKVGRKVGMMHDQKGRVKKGKSNGKEKRSSQEKDYLLRFSSDIGDVGIGSVSLLVGRTNLFAR